MSVASSDLTKLAVDTIRTLSMDAVQTANSGPGTPMALAPIAYQLFNHTMNYDPAQPELAIPRSFCFVMWSRIHAALQRSALVWCAED